MKKYNPKTTKMRLSKSRNKVGDIIEIFCREVGIQKSYIEKSKVKNIPIKT